MIATRLFTVSALLLFYELVLIRYLASEIPAVGFFKNLVLIAAFFGLGLGLNLKLEIRRSFTLFSLTSLLPHLFVVGSSITGLNALAYPGGIDEAVLVPGSHFAFGLVSAFVSFGSVLIPMVFLGRLLGWQ